MGNYRCYLCNEEFFFLGSLEKHSQFGKCPKITKEMHEQSLKPFIRILTTVTYVDPKKLRNKEDFQYSMKVDAYYPYDDVYQRLQENAVRIAHSVSAKSGVDVK